MSAAISVTAATFDEVVLKSSTPVLVDFWAEWCGPCRMIAPVIEELANDYDGKAKICKVNTDEEQEIAVKFGIRSIPTIMFFKDGKMVDQVVGAQSKAALAQKIDALLA